MILAVTIDVEEEGLFGGQYAERDAPVENVPRLALLDGIFRELGIRPTLLVSYQVARHPKHQELLLRLRDRWDGEIGAHLHHWNTPPLDSVRQKQPVHSELMPTELLEAKLNTLLDTLSEMGIQAASFRMGRFNLGPRMLSVLERSPISTDSSIAPLRKEPAGPDHLAAPTEPYFPDPACPTLTGSSSMLEVPITMVPTVRIMRDLLAGIEKRDMVSASTLAWFSRTFVALPAQPIAMGLRRLKAAVRLHQSRGGEVLTVYFHSSELMPGGCPQHQTESDVNRFVDKLRSYFSWLRKGRVLDSLTLSQVGDLFRERASASK